MRQAIVTKYLGPTNHRGSRILVKAQAGRMTVPWDHALDSDDNHTAAAYQYAKAKGWIGQEAHAQRWALAGGGLPDGTGNCYVLITLPTCCALAKRMSDGRCRKCPVCREED